MWLCLGIYALAMFVFTMVWLFFKLRDAYRALRFIEVPTAEPAAMDASVRAPAPTGNAETVTTARVMRAEIKQQREINRQRRLRRAQERWASYGLADSPQ